MSPKTERAIQRMDYMKYGPHPLSLLGCFVLLVCGLFIGLLLVLNAVVPRCASSFAMFLRPCSSNLSVPLKKTP